MARKKTQEIGLMGASRDIVIGGSILGVGASVVARTGGSGAGISAAASFLPVMGATIGGGLALRHLQRLQGTKKRKR